MHKGIMLLGNIKGITTKTSTEEVAIKPEIIILTFITKLTKIKTRPKPSQRSKRYNQLFQKYLLTRTQD